MPQSQLSGRLVVPVWNLAGGSSAFRFAGRQLYTEHFHFQKLRRLFGRAPMHRVRPFRAPVLRWLLCALAARISSITVFIEKRQSFRKIKCRWTPTTPAERFGRSCPLPGHGYSVIESLAKGTTPVSPSNRP